MSTFKGTVGKQLEDMGKEASLAFLRKEEPLNETIEKMARDSDLSPDEVARVCEAANHETFQSLFATEEDKTFEFKVANCKEVLDGINKNAAIANNFSGGSSGNEKSDAMVKTVDRQFESDVVIDRGRKDLEAEKVEQKAGIQVPALAKSAEFDEKEGHYFRGSPRQVIVKAAADYQLAMEELKQARAEHLLKLEKTANSMIEEIRPMVFDGDSLNKIGEVMCKAKPKASAAVHLLMKMAAEKLHKPLDSDGFIKSAAAICDSQINTSLTIGDQPVKVINGDHPIIAQLDTLVEQANKVDENLKGYVWVRDKVKYLHGKVREMFDQEHNVEV